MILRSAFRSLGGETNGVLGCLICLEVILLSELLVDFLSVFHGYLFFGETSDVFFGPLI